MDQEKILAFDCAAKAIEAWAKVFDYGGKAYDEISASCDEIHGLLPPFGMSKELQLANDTLVAAGAVAYMLSDNDVPENFAIRNMLDMYGDNLYAIFDHLHELIGMRRQQQDVACLLMDTVSRAAFRYKSMPSWFCYPKKSKEQISETTSQFVDRILDTHEKETRLAKLWRCPECETIWDVTELLFCQTQSCHKCPGCGYCDVCLIERRLGHDQQT